jgi:dihydroneopterin aldolase
MAFTTSIVINNLKIYAYHGVGQQERTVGNMFDVSLRIGYPADRAMLSDDINDAVSYAVIVNIVKKVMSVPSNLLEHVAQRIADSILWRYPDVESIDITLLKVTPPISADLASAGFVYSWSK